MSDLTSRKLVQHLADEGVQLARACRRSRRRSLPARSSPRRGADAARAVARPPRCAPRGAGAGAVITTTASNGASPPVSYRSGISVTATSASDPLQPRLLLAPRRAGGAALRARRAPPRSANTISAIRARSVVPNRSSSAARTSGSSAISRWTTSSADSVGTPRRANARSASLLPAPMPPVMATARRHRPA